MDNEQKKVLDRLEAQCSRREYCEGDVRQKARKALAGDEARAEEIVESLKKDKFVDNLRYASAFAREKSSLGGWGPVKIRYALAAKGIDKASIDGALESVDIEAASDKLERLISARARSLEGDPQQRLKVIKYALSRGYDYEEIKKHLDKI